MSYPESNPGANPTNKKGPKPHMDADGGIKSQANKVHRELEGERDSIRDTSLTWKGGRDNDSDQFPAKYLPTDHEKDLRFKTKAELGPGNLNLGQTFVTDEDINYLIQKRKYGDQVMFDNWYSKLWDMKDINKLRIAQQIHPRYFQMREEEIGREAELQKKLAMIRLRGPADLSDLQLIYALQHGNVQLRNVPLWKLDQSTETTAQQYQKGIFNPTYFFGTTQQPKDLGYGVINKDGVVPPSANATTLGLGNWTNPKVSEIPGLIM